MYPATAPRAYYPALDLLRGIAILAVLCYHCFGYTRFVAAGWMGVDLFFVLSGFLITDLLLVSVHQKFYFRNFFVRRTLRIFPLYYFVLFVFYIALPYLGSNGRAATTYAYYSENKLWFWSYLQNWFMVEKGHAPVPYLSHFWSLAVEEQFYFLWPFVLFLLRRSRHLALLIVFLIVASVIYRGAVWTHHRYTVEAYFYNTFCRMDCLLMGSLLAVCLKQGKSVPKMLPPLSIAGFAALCTGSLIRYGNVQQDNPLFATVGYTITAAFLGSVLYLFLKNEERWIKALRQLRFLSLMGKFSYGLYVFHFPVYLLMATQFSAAFARLTGDAFTGNLLLSVTSLLLTTLLSLASFHVIEKPALRLRRHFV